MPFDHHLSDAISDRGNPQRARLAIALWYVDPSHRWRKVAARRQTIPEFVEVVPKISLEVRNRLAVYASRPLVGSNPLVGFSHLPFRNVIRLCSVHEGPPVAGCPQARAEQRNPFAPAPLQDLHHYYGLLRPCARIGTLTLIGSTYLDFSLSIGATGSRVPHRSLVQSHAASMPDAVWAVIRPSPRLVPG
jgi:hypothetical protein